MSTVTVTITVRPAVCRGPPGAPRTAFVLAGGTALGALQAGMVRALYERGIVADLLVGTSAGALNAAFPASRPPTVATAGALAAIWHGLRRRDVLPLRPRMVGVWGLCGRGLALSREPQRQRRRSGDSCVSRPGPVPGPAVHRDPRPCRAGDGCPGDLRGHRRPAERPYRYPGPAPGQP